MDLVQGRGKVAFFSLEGVQLVRKHYRRGGWVARWIEDQYLYTGLQRTRMAREMRLLQSLRQQQLPVPEPVAFRCLRPTPLSYTGDLVTVMVENSKSLGSHLRRHPLPSALWIRIGETVGRFHRASVFHADLNIENILLSDASEITLLDFDKSRFMQSFCQSGIQNNLKRLKRSLQKSAARSSSFYFSEQEWEHFQSGHKMAMEAS